MFIVPMMRIFSGLRRVRLARSVNPGRFHSSISALLEVLEAFQQLQAAAHFAAADHVLRGGGTGPMLLQAENSSSLNTDVLSKPCLRRTSYAGIRGLLS
ncbi:MAG: hypothetical protein GY953_09040 [bacterium]|nr:hypothetical protein [bacterium]